MTTLTADAVSAAGIAACDRALPAWLYRDPEFLELEREHLFMPSWHLVCHVCDLPQAGAWYGFRMFGENVFVVRGEDGQVRGFYNVCRHRAARLLDGERGQCPKRVSCPYHAWSYALDGRLVGVPFRSEYPDFETAQHGLVPVECETAFGFVFVRLEPGGASLADMLAPIAADLALYRIEQMQPEYPISARVRQCNWKNGNDNYIDALHVRAAHPGLNSLLGDTYTLAALGTANRLEGTVESLGYAGWPVRAYAKYLPDVEHLPERLKKRWLYYQVWPNMAFNLYPDFVEFMQFIPISPTETLVRDGAYSLPDSRREMRIARWLNLRINRQVGIEDRDLIERVQDGMMSRSYVSGPLGIHESCLRGYAEIMRRTLPVSQLLSPPPRGTVAERNREMALGRG